MSDTTTAVAALAAEVSAYTESEGLPATVTAQESGVEVSDAQNPGTVVGWVYPALKDGEKLTVQVPDGSPVEVDDVATAVQTLANDYGDRLVEAILSSLFGL